MRSTAVPGLANLASYRAQWLRSDIVAGLVLTALLVPQGTAYAELAGLPPHHRPVHLHPLPGGIRGLRPVEDPRPGPRLLYDNFQRPYGGLGGQTPFERLRRKTIAQL